MTEGPKAKTRPPFNEIYMRLALSMAERSTCARLNVGCAITSNDYRKVLAVGYNGGAASGPNDCDRHGEEAVGNCGCIHAEQNAVINCRAARSEPKVVFCTHLPCVTCAKFLINLGGVVRVFYHTDYRIKDSLDWFERASIKAAHLQVPR
jgi:dCMP deaminase